MGQICSKKSNKIGNQFKILETIEHQHFQVQKINHTLFENGLIRELNKQKSQNKQEQIFEFIDLRKNPTDQLILAQQFTEITAEMQKLFKTLYDFKNIFMIYDNSDQYEQFLQYFNAAHVVPKSINVISNSSLKDFLEKNQFFKNTPENLDMLKNHALPMTLFRNQDFKHAIKFSILIQSYKSFSENIQTNPNFYSKFNTKLFIFFSQIENFKELQSNENYLHYQDKISFNKIQKEINNSGVSIFVYDPSDNSFIQQMYQILLKSLQKSPFLYKESTIQNYINQILPNFLQKIDIKTKQDDDVQIVLVNKNNNKSDNRCDEFQNNLKQINKKQRDQKFDTIILLLNNIINNPSEEKFRQLKKQNPKLSSTLFENSKALIILKDCGFILDENSGIFENKLDITSLKLIKADLNLAYERMKNNK